METSHDILVHIKAGNTENFQRFVAERGERDLNVLLEPSVCMEYRLRTPLMVAAAEGDFELFTAVRDEVYKHSDTEVSRILHCNMAITGLLIPWFPAVASRNARTGRGRRRTPPVMHSS